MCFSSRIFFNFYHILAIGNSLYFVVFKVTIVLLLLLFLRFSIWREVMSFVFSVRAVVALNLHSYGSGRNPWGNLKPEYLEKVWNSWFLSYSFIVVKSFFLTMSLCQSCILFETYIGKLNFALLVGCSLKLFFKCI